MAIVARRTIWGLHKLKRLTVGGCEVFVFTVNRWMTVNQKQWKARRTGSAANEEAPCGGDVDGMSAQTRLCTVHARRRKAK